MLKYPCLLDALFAMADIVVCLIALVFQQALR